MTEQSAQLRGCVTFVGGLLAPGVTITLECFCQSLQSFGDDVEAQSGATLQTKGWTFEIGLGMYNMDRYNPNPDQFVDDWVRTLPAECDLVTLGEYQLAYRCPAS